MPPTPGGVTTYGGNLLVSHGGDSEVAVLDTTLPVRGSILANDTRFEVGSQTNNNTALTTNSLDIMLLTPDRDVFWYDDLGAQQMHWDADLAHLVVGYGETKDTPEVCIRSTIDGDPKLSFWQKLVEQGSLSFDDATDNIILSTAASIGIDLAPAGTSAATLSSDGLKLFGSTIQMDEVSAANFASEAGKATVWLKDESPNKLYFTDDAGTDWDLTAGFLTEDANGNIFGGTNAGNALAITSADNLLIGVNAGAAVLSGKRNVVLGDNAFTLADADSGNIAIGYFALKVQNVAGVNTHNVAIGENSMSSLTGGVRNVGVGTQTGLALTSGFDNTFIGHSAGLLITTGQGNTFIGDKAGQFIELSSSDNVCLGEEAGPFTQGVYSNQLWIHNASVDEPLIGGNFVTGQLTTSGTWRFKERTDHINTPTAGYGELWLKNDTPNALIFTDDAGTDFDLTAASAADVSKVGTPVDDQVGVWTGDGTIEGTTNLTFASSVLNVTGTVNATTEYLFTEQADHNFTPAATRGILWVRNDTPNVLVFTDDAGTDTVLGTGGGGGGGETGMLKPCRTATTDDIDTETSLTWSATSTTLTAPSNGTTILGGVTLADGDRVLVKDQAVAAENGPYVASDTGAGAPTVLTRVDEFDEDAEIIPATTISVAEGDNADTTWILTTDGSVTVGTTSLAWGLNSTVFKTDGLVNLYAGEGAGASLNPVGLGASHNFLAGSNAGNKVSIGDYNIAIGEDALATEDAGKFNIALGDGALQTQNAGINTYNTAIGSNALNVLTTGVRNIAIGAGCGITFTTGFDNLFIGYQAANSITSGADNTIIGTQAADHLTAGSTGNVVIGNFAGPESDIDTDNQLWLHNTESDEPLIGGNFVTGIVKLKGALRFTERADHIETPAATFGEVWLKNDAPNKLYFTDDAGSDFDLLADLGEYTVAGLPTASANSNRYALATDASGGRTVVRSDGTNWKVIAVEGATVTT